MRTKLDGIENWIDEAGPMSELVSIIIPTLNRREWLEDTLDSVRAQTYPFWEAIVVDDGSTDGTCEFVKNLSTEEPRIRLRRRQGEKGNANICRNQGFSNSSGEYALFLDSDDLLMPQCLENRVATMKRNQDLDYAIWTAQMFYDKPGDCELLFKLDNSGDHLERFLRLDPPWQTTGVIWPRASLEAVGLWNENLPSWQDWELHLRALVSGMKYLWFQEPDYFFRTAAPDTTWTSLSSKEHSDPQHLEMAEFLLDDVRKLLLQESCLTTDKRDALGGIYFVLAERWKKLGNQEKARSVWMLALVRKLISSKTYTVGRFFLAMSHPRWKLSKLKHKWLWSRHLDNREIAP
jgi:glycosyltransferase involved in cell wall biosynthesis